MGLGIAILIGAGLLIVSVVFKRIFLLYGLLFLIIMFTEIGAGFSSFEGSWVFNQDFIGIANLKLIEIVIAMLYFFALFTNRNKTPGMLRPERRLFIFFVAWIVIVCIVEYYYHAAVNVSDWRLMISGFMLFHLFVLMLRTEKELLDFLKVFLMMTSLSALVGLITYWAGYGVDSPRGKVPFFWDTRHVDIFVLSVIILSAYLVSYRFLPSHGKLFPSSVAAMMLLIILLTILLSIRRTEWMMAFGGISLIFFLSKAAKVQHIVALLLAVIIGLSAVLVLPGLEGFRQRMAGYVDSMNLASKEVTKQQDNAVHIDNIEQYVRIISEEPEILYFGYRGREGSDYMVFKGGEYGLGLAHNSIIRPIQHFGVMGAVMYLLLFIRLFMLFPTIARLPQNSTTKYFAVGSLVYLFMLFLPSLLFSPPFYTTIKGVFSTFLAIFLIRASLFYSFKSDSNKSVKS